MKIRHFLMALLLSFGSLAAHAAGSPLNESFTNLIALSNNALEIGKKGDTQAFIDSATIAWEALKEQNEKGSSIRLQRANAKLKAAIKAAKAGNLQEGIADVEQGIVEMQLEKK
ncbi:MULTISPECIES: hypothetical protein [Methylomonas]|uniref:Uncharacterized protein n=2 Tax=Methylomonas TaxID=416 RepID=A0A126T910_9GAMM|nr:MULTISPECIES: hypothetical protein [Methylomonas]AMK78567.1 hypothetical protein JT25_019070 [Methylomonas denitrificans]OAH98899.1 hypothetical protein A1342_09925 [Methylomonas methanica]TCV77402.1 hypothetical protein EDE11_12927 [Methylomonas methanica]